MMAGMVAGAEAAGHMASTAGKQREMDAVLSSLSAFVESGILAHGMVLPILKRLTTSLNPV